MSHQTEHFLDFVKKLEGVLGEYPKNTTEFQQAQVEGLMTAECNFRYALIHHPHGPEVYASFVNLIMVEKHNILMARPFFRERDVNFKAHIAPALRRGIVGLLYRFNINYQFVNFVMKCRPWGKDPQSKKLMRLANEVLKRREELVECNIPLAISQARMFYSRNRASHLSFMDFMQIACGGLAAGVDKFVGDYTTKFRSVLIGRILGDLIEANSDTFVHFFPADKRRLYRIRKIAASLREGISLVDCEVLAQELNKTEIAKGEELTLAADLHHLVNAASLIAASTIPRGEDEDEMAGTPIENYPDADESRPDRLYETAQVQLKVGEAVRTLPLIDQKLLRLKGVDFDMLGV